MASITYKGVTYQSRENETVLDAFLRQGVSIPFSCRNGVCHACMARCVHGKIPTKAQAGLRESLRQRGYFLPCKCVPREDFEMAPPREEDLFVPAVVQTKELLAPDVCRLLLEPSTGFVYYAGQSLQARRPDGLTRAYSLVSLADEDPYLEIHVKRVPGGAMSNWIFDELAEGAEIEIHGPAGESHYALREMSDKDLLFIATGTGVGPVLGVVQEALNNRHRGQIHVFHGSRTATGLYEHEHLRALAARHANVRYTGCLSGEDMPGTARGRVHDVAFAAHRDLRDWHVFIYGRPEMVQAAVQRARAAGAAEKAIHADAFGALDADAAPGANAAAATARPPEGRPRDPVPDPEMWAALREGELLSEVLNDFYTRVYADPRLSPFFHGITKQRVIEKQYLFLRQIFSGERVYFGDRPRNAHHWMVISDELFDYREDLMAAALRDHGVPEHLIQRFRQVDEVYRTEMVKSSPWPRVIDGVEMPLDGFGEAVLDVGSICDGCQSEIPAGMSVRYHLRLGSVYCPDCDRGSGV